MIGYLGKYYIYMGLVSLFKDTKDYNNSDIIHNNNNTNDTIDNNTIINQTDFTKSLQMKIDEKYIFFILCGIYFLCIILSILFYYSFKYYIFEKNNNENKFNCFENCCIWNSFFKIFNCSFYIEKIKVENTKKRDNCTLCGETIKNYCDNVWSSIVNFFCLFGEKKQYKCCCCCCEYNKEDYDKDTQFFCYCYQEKGCCEWIDKFITNESQQEIIPSIILYFLSRLSSIGSEQDFNEKNDNLNIQQGKFILLFIFCFLSYLSFFIASTIYKKCIKHRNKKYLYRILINSIKLYSLEFLFLQFSVSFGLSISIGYLKDSGKKNKWYNSNNLCCSMIFNKLFFFTFNYYCSNASENNGTNELLLSQSTLITIYLFIIDIIVYLIKYLVSKTLKKLYIIQLVFSSVIGFVVFFTFIWSIISNFIIALISLKVCICEKEQCFCNCCCCDEHSLCRGCYSENCKKSCFQYNVSLFVYKCLDKFDLIKYNY